ncbi:hypothetical protein [Aquipseudomonas ullengensis]|uniref:Uncharacterized protein n=1 Tax=Aquipseudomonas ullengensis TaxID=2759166 RepID=A0A7W4LMF7_9GAMM|nr:hypothetical protein [Pseudomonas ullengensis]MBB2495866.1 hypothetical protein [Pseudomonas ullengensis]
MNAESAFEADTHDLEPLPLGDLVVRTRYLAKAVPIYFLLIDQLLTYLLANQKAASGKAFPLSGKASGNARQPVLPPQTKTGGHWPPVHLPALRFISPYR